MKKDTKRTLAKVATGSAVFAALAGISPQAADARNLVDFTVLGSGAQIRAEVLQSLSGSFQLAGDPAAKEGEGKCGSHKADGKSAEGKCGEGKCGTATHGKAVEGKCGTKEHTDKTAEAKCGEGKCGSHKEADKAKAAEGKCGEGKCGSKKE